MENENNTSPQPVEKPERPEGEFYNALETNRPAQNDTQPPQNNYRPRSKGMVTFLRFLVIGGGFFSVFVIGLGVSFSACFTIKGPPPPECGPVSFVTLVLMPGASLFFFIPLAKKIK